LGNNSLILLALLALIICVLLQPITLSRPAYRFQVTFDISQSMNVEDLVIDGAVASRLTLAKRAARDLIQSLPCGSFIGWSIFTERRVATLTLPLEVCQHYAGLLTALEFIDGTMRWAEASGIGKGLHQSIRAADEIGDSTRLLFMTDGHEAPPLRSGDRGMPRTDKYAVSGLIIGLGDTVPVRIPKTDSDGQFIGYWQANEVVQRSSDTLGPSHEELSRRQDEHLRTLGRLSELNYLALESPEQLLDAALNKTFSHERVMPIDLRWIPASIALLLLLWRFVPTRVTRIKV
jgi:mxaL protein